MSSPVSVEFEDKVCVVQLDDGKVNAVSHELIGQVHEALDQAADEARAVCFLGREGVLSAGFDLKVMTSGVEGTRGLAGAGGKLIMRMLKHPQPTVIAVTGHAIAAGAGLVLACDSRIGTDDPSAKIGFNETAIGMGLPNFVVELADLRLSRRHLTRAIIQAELYAPDGALDAGFLDEVVPTAEVTDRALAEARRLAELPSGAYAFTKARQREEIATRLAADVDRDMESLTPPVA